MTSSRHFVYLDISICKMADAISQHRICISSKVTSLFTVMVLRLKRPVGYEELSLWLPGLLSAAHHGLYLCLSIVLHKKISESSEI